MIFISEEQPSSWFRAKQIAKYGNIVSYCPLSRLVNSELSENGLFDTVNLEVRAAQGGKKLKIDFPRERKIELTLIERAMGRRVTATVGMSGFVQLLTDMDTTSGRIE